MSSLNHIFPIYKDDMMAHGTVCVQSFMYARQPVWS